MQPWEMWPETSLLDRCGPAREGVDRPRRFDLFCQGKISLIIAVIIVLLIKLIRNL